MVGSSSVLSTFQEDEIPFSMSMVERRRALETGIARRVSTLVSCCPPLSAGIAVSFAVRIDTGDELTTNLRRPGFFVRAAPGFLGS
jgi:hypothetical protein